MIKNYFKSAWRSIWKNKTTSVINIGGLSVGMTAAVLILLWVQNETSFDNYKEKNNIYRLTTRLPELGWVWETTPLLLADALKNQVPEIEQVTRLYTNNQPVFNIKGNLFYAKDCAYVDEEWFSMFHYRFLAGNAASFTDYPFSIIVTAAEAKKYFGNANAFGQTIHIDSVDYTVRGVVEDAAINSSFQYKAYMPIAVLQKNVEQRQNDEQWGNANYISFVKTKPGSNPVTIGHKISNLAKKKSADENAAPIDLVSLADMHFETELQNSAFIHGNRNAVYIFAFLGFLLLLIACINYINLTTAKASLRAREVSIRKISGASRYQLFLQFVAESVLISLFSLGATLLLVQLCLPVFNQLTGRTFQLPLTAASLWQVLGIALSATFLLNSIYPAILLSSFKPLSVFRGINVLKVKDSTFRRSLVVLQFTISVILIASTLVIYRQMQFVQKGNPGYNRSQVLSVYLPYSINGQHKQSLMLAIKQDLLAQPGVEGVSSANQPIVNIGSMCTGCAEWTGHDSSYHPKIAQLSVDADYQQVMQLQMKEGRWFRQEDGPNAHGFILNETAVKNFNLSGQVTGTPFIFKGDTGQIIGVVKDFTYHSMHEKTGPLVVFNNPGWRNQFVIRIAALHSPLALKAITSIWKKYIPDSPLEYTFLDETFNNLYKSDQQTSFLILVFAVIAVVISALGLFSLAAFAAVQRTREIGIRKVLGCSVTGITTLLSKDFILLVAVAIVIASPIAWWAMDMWLQNFAYRVNIGWLTFAAAGLLALLIALLTTSTQAIRAALTNPVESLRTE